MSAPTKYVITLVHGTFAPQAAWTKEDSKLCRFLKERLQGPVRFQRFGWTGTNTHTARIAASEGLRAQVLAEMKDSPDATHFIIGHSHGGNIALYGTGGSDLDGGLAGIFCLDTPFVCATRRSHNQVLFFLFHALALLLFFIGIGLPSMSLVPLLRGETFVSWRSLLTAVPVGAAFVASSWLLLRRRGALADWIVRRQTELIVLIKLPVIKRTPVHCLWAPSDEVIGIFSFLDAITSLPYIFMHPIALSMLFAAGFLLFGVWPETAYDWLGPTHWGLHTTFYDQFTASVIVFVAFVGDALTGGGGNYRGGWLFFGVILATLAVALVIMASLVAALIAQTVMRLLPMGVTWHRFFDSLFVHLTFTQTPVSARHVEFSDVGTSVSLLMHSAIYNDDQALERLLQGILSCSEEQAIPIEGNPA
jgi:hypothetical protein